MRGKETLLSKISSKDVFYLTEAQAKILNSGATDKSPEARWPHDTVGRLGTPIKELYGGCPSAAFVGSVGWVLYPPEALGEPVIVQVVEADDLSVTESLYFHRFSAREVIASGWDPEFFVEKKGEILPAFTFLPDKKKPLKGGVSESQAAHLFADGFAGEYSFTRSRGCHGYGIDDLRYGLQFLHSEATRFDSEAKLSAKSFFTIPPKYLIKATDDQIAFGCNPSENVYEEGPIDLGDPRTVPFRTAGGHIHFSLSNSAKKVIPRVVKAMDKYLALPCVALFDGIDNPMRRTMYGRAGEFRPKSYGLEYRVLSNAWLLVPPVAHLVLNLARASVKAGVLGGDYIPLPEEEVREIINAYDAPRARKFVEKNWDVFSNIGGMDLHSFASSKRLWSDGLQSIPEWDNLLLNWRLKDSWSSHSNASYATWSVYSREVYGKTLSTL